MVMNMRGIKIVLASVGLAGMVAACATSAPGVMIGSKPGAIPPRIVNDPKNPQSKTWDHPEAFGPVPAALAARGHAVCSALDTKDVKYEAIGYHPKAEDYYGRPFPGGGFFCAAK